MGGTKSYANGINDSRQIVGSSTFAGDSVTHAFHYANGVMITSIIRNRYHPVSRGSRYNFIHRFGVGNS
ncbi:hypothetical protein [Candidatus Contendibacter odensensis]